MKNDCKQLSHRCLLLFFHFYPKKNQELLQSHALKVKGPTSCCLFFFACACQFFFPDWSIKKKFANLPIDEKKNNVRWVFKYNTTNKQWNGDEWWWWCVFAPFFLRLRAFLFAFLLKFSFRFHRTGRADSSESLNGRRSNNSVHGRSKRRLLGSVTHPSRSAIGREQNGRWWWRHDWTKPNRRREFEIGSDCKKKNRKRK